MKQSYLALLLFTVATFTQPWAQAAEQVDKTAELAPGSKLDIHIQRGDVQIHGWDKAQVAIKGTLDELSEGLVFSRDGSRFVIKDKLPDSYSGHDEQGSRLTIYLPMQVNANIKGVSANYLLEHLKGEVNTGNVSGDINSQGLQGELNIKTVSGNIRAKDNSGQIEMESVSGDIDDQGSSGNIRYRLVSGDLTADIQARSVSADLVSGSATLQLQQADNLNLRSVSGDLQVTLQSLTTKAHLGSVNADIDLIFTQVPDAAFNIKGGPGGNIHNTLTDDKPTISQYTRNQRLKFQSGSGKADIDINTISGDISLKQQ
ncbi:DUF4097 family beta strand repeat-containing protein [Shewanella sp. YIC-542]|uniref:DUF4097 family beta strand repeat-containing protein n=1 Tax=Shewanella mytili TaxID=3377111 RepID=UPI00398E5D37